ncbi:MAG: nucleoside hydrolase [Verrucomicrobia bacterium]|nr:nucleoside hydrolase [Verrucomicrobiota bacterium]
MKPRHAFLHIALATLCGLATSEAFAADAPAPTSPPPKAPPVKIIFDTDIGNDVDDALAMGVLHSLMTRGDCELLAVTTTKPDELAGPFVDAINTFYGRGDIPIACTRKESLPKGSKFLLLADRYPHDLKSSADTQEPVKLLRQILGKAADQSLVLVQVGFFSNFAALLDSPADDCSPLKGKELVKQKVKLLSVMAGGFQTVNHNNHYLEYNVIKDIPAAQKLAKEWPTPIVWSGFEIGIAVPYPAVSIERDYSYVPHHPLAEAYYLYTPPPHDRPTWDLTAVLYAVLPDRGFFELSQPGQVTVEDDGFTRFKPKKSGGRDRFLILNDVLAARVKEALVQLSSQPPRGLKP